MISHWDQRFIELAKHISSWSKDPSTKCGCVIVDNLRRVIGIGFNGFPRGVIDDELLYNDRNEKYARVVHSELNAILNCLLRPEGATLYVWTSSGWSICNECAKAIIQSGIKRVVMSDLSKSPDRSKFSCKVAVEMFNQGGVVISEYE